MEHFSLCEHEWVSPDALGLRVSCHKCGAFPPGREPDVRAWLSHECAVASRMAEREGSPYDRAWYKGRADTLKELLAMLAHRSNGHGNPGH